ncbi:hypothetical protein VC83_05754 [Pseudogymnoascus destructans]|uniref:Uncharacterized protein n=1 Tax=Pseudogymnoascus destructans TaxID=655981 RepID=A0A177A861_9PEZI|nr:uncharacterized protein VC83_05754 [Pseudogymnoascus destructans]OAF57622.1 hypothetical protein VC83_05754 [Pseudogymnoascus destructans]
MPTSIPVLFGVIHTKLQPPQKKDKELKKSEVEGSEANRRTEEDRAFDDHGDFRDRGFRRGYCPLPDTSVGDLPVKAALRIVHTDTKDAYERVQGVAVTTTTARRTIQKLTPCRAVLRLGIQWRR